MNSDIILVNENDEVVGYAEKLDAHRKQLLHRGFSIFIFDWSTKKLLLQKRASGKYHSGGLWSNACCSHPRKDEDLDECLSARLEGELGIKTQLHIVNPKDCGLLIDEKDVIYSCGKFTYFVSYGEISENEIDYVFLYSPIINSLDLSHITYNKEEVEAIKWVTIEELNTWMEREPTAFTAWFQPAFELAYDVLCRQARNLDMFSFGM